MRGALTIVADPDAAEIDWASMAAGIALAPQPTEQQARFIAEYLANGGNASQAYKIAYPKAENWTDNAVRVAALQAAQGLRSQGGDREDHGS